MRFNKIWCGSSNQVTTFLGRRHSMCATFWPPYWLSWLCVYIELVCEARMFLCWPDIDVAVCQYVGIRPITRYGCVHNLTEVYKIMIMFAYKIIKMLKINFPKGGIGKNTSLHTKSPWTYTCITLVAWDCEQGTDCIIILYWIGSAWLGIMYPGCM